jgi:hypothetical protein
MAHFNGSSQADYNTAFGFRPGLAFPVRVGFGVLSGIAHVPPNFSAPFILPALQSICTCRGVTSQRAAISSGVTYPFITSASFSDETLYHHIIFGMPKQVKPLS